jgi:DNA-binding transcriptional LysR family regulator
MDRFASITAFVRVAESGGFSAAGRRLNLSKATVSDHVQALENALGVRLLNRTTRRVSLTEIGRSYYERCVQILHDLEEADEIDRRRPTGNPARPAPRPLPTWRRAVRYTGRRRLSRPLP